MKKILTSLFFLLVLTACTDSSEERAQTVYSKTILMLNQFNDGTLDSKKQTILGDKIKSNIDTLNNDYVETNIVFEMLNSGLIGQHNLQQFRAKLKELQFAQSVKVNPYLLLEAKLHDINQAEPKLHLKTLGGLLNAYAERNDRKSFNRIASKVIGVDKAKEYILHLQLSNFKDQDAVRLLKENSDYKTYKEKLSLAIAEGYLINELSIPNELRDLFKAEFYGKYASQKFTKLFAKYNPTFKADLCSATLDTIIDEKENATTTNNKLYHYNEAFDCYLTHFNVDDKFKKAYLTIIDIIKKELSLYHKTEHAADRVHFNLEYINELAYKHPIILDIFDLDKLNQSAESELIRSKNKNKSSHEADRFKSEIYYQAVLAKKEGKEDTKLNSNLFNLVNYVIPERNNMTDYEKRQVANILYKVNQTTLAIQMLDEIDSKISISNMAEKGKHHEALIELLNASEIKSFSTWIKLTSSYLDIVDEADDIYISNSTKLLNKIVKNLTDSNAK
ncbi:hypothetical protein [Pseudoalteromonas sp. S1688]|uniref:hypothetical protein n=1 Tax=Pseudoalteromonas sp. S1688 TaxID=579511 RepID=UPI00110A5273|nr:hypothetical protein [Pseudoalteromonas sp. S1688]TMP48455.1 hypothetical protein CWB81_16605 [Pseudoalteromonas sp. S1688]